MISIVIEDFWFVFSYHQDLAYDKHSDQRLLICIFISCTYGVSLLNYLCTLEKLSLMGKLFIVYMIHISSQIFYALFT